FFTAWDLILTPAAAALPWPAHQVAPPVIDGQAVGPRGHAIFTNFANLAGLPGIALPCEPAESGLPIGFQLVGPAGADGLLCAPSPAAAQRGAVLADFADLAERVQPAVVNIAVTSEQRAEIPPELRGTPFERYFRDRQRNRRQEVMGAGSGFVIDPAGYIVTN